MKKAKTFIEQGWLVGKEPDGVIEVGIDFCDDSTTEATVFRVMRGDKDITDEYFNEA